MDGRRPEMRRTMTLSEQLSTPDPAIRDFLKIPHDADVGEGDSPSDVDAQGGGRTTRWKKLRDRLRLRRAAGAWQRPKPGAAPAHAPTNGGGLSKISSANNRSNKYNYSPGEAAAAFSRTFSRATPTFSRVASTRVGPASSRSSSRRPATYDFRDVEERYHEDEDEDEDDDGEEEEEDDDEDEGGEENEAAPAAQMSLMALLGETDSQWDDDEEEEEVESGGVALKKGAVGDDDEDDGDGDGREDEMVHVCCVCMVRHKGAAFIPCGHTFCRLCSRELWVSRGNCPLCNGFIQEILDIF